MFIFKFKDLIRFSIHFMYFNLYNVNEKLIIIFTIISKVYQVRLSIIYHHENISASIYVI